MSKRVKDLLTKDFSSRLDGVDDALLVNVIGMDANKTVVLRRQLREKNIQLMVVRNSLAQAPRKGHRSRRPCTTSKAIWHLSGAPKTLSAWPRKLRS